MAHLSDSEHITDSGPEPLCSARGCRQAARWAVIWNNPRIHTPDREKIWAACDEHRTTLADFLSARSMLLRVDPLGV
ncbi:hypothetical protein [Tomitella gaofuii]|uniref:hypothetical protein n=1 Tax=Tomitella gaofuii TaxID=2760083 RepID=UPI001C71139E|nr:hypothetical protein [Tomitella gaofuii]